MYGGLAGVYGGLLGLAGAYGGLVRGGWGALGKGELWGELASEDLGKGECRAGWDLEM